MSFVTITDPEDNYTLSGGRRRTNMTQKSEDKPTLSSLQHLAAIEKLKHEQLPEQPLEPWAALLKTWQTRRMAATYADLLAMPRYKLACEFFLTDIDA